MSGRLLQKLRDWRDKQASRRGVEKYRVLQNKSLEEIAQKEPASKEELLEIHGIAEKKFSSYGQELLDIVAGQDEDDSEDSDEPVSVAKYLSAVNSRLTDMEARVKGEIVEFDIRSNYLFFQIKDPEAEAAMQCFMWRRDYDVSDVEIEEGMEVAVEGLPEVYAPSGRFTFRASVIELVGEGALKKVYEKLKAKLAEAGLFAVERKQELPSFPQQVGLITSKESDAYHDFLANLGSFGFSVQFHPSRVQGAKAVKDLLKALEYFENEDSIDGLVITRGGGGNLEVLQAFNNEAVVRKLASLDMPVIVGIGHEQDQPLAAMAADVSVSTPTAAAELLNQPWEKLTQKIQNYQQQIIHSYDSQLQQSRSQLTSLTQSLQGHMEKAFLSFREVINALQAGLQSIAHNLNNSRRRLQSLSEKLVDSYADDLVTTAQRIDQIEDQLKRVNPQRRLEQGYSIVSADGAVVDSIAGVSAGQEVSIQVADGTINSEVTSKNSHNEQ